MPKISHRAYSFDDFTLDLARCCLLRAKQEVKLRLRPFEVLRYLVENRGRLVGKDELMQAIWPDSFVTDDSLVQCLVEVRRVLGDDSQRYIRTVPRRGYIFDAQVIIDDRGERGGGKTGERESGGMGEGESGGVGEGESKRAGERESKGVGEGESRRVGDAETMGKRELRSASPNPSVTPSPDLSLSHSPIPPFPGSPALPLSPSPAFPLPGSPTPSVSPSPANSLSRSSLRWRWRASQKIFVVAATAMIAIVLYIFVPWGSTPVERKSIAVLPFRNLSDDKANEYFSDGITDDIITQLSKIGDLKVISRTSVMRYKNGDKNLRDIAKELGVATVLEGSVRRAGDQVRISSRLIDARTDEHIWAEVYDRDIKDIFEIQSDVARRVATALRAKFSQAERERLEKRPTANLTAYDYYLRGREFYYLYNKWDNETAIEFFKKALELDPNYALAYAGLSDAYSQRVQRFGFQPAWIDRSIEVAKEAISIDPAIAEGYKALGLAEMQKGWYRKALEEFGKAIELNPNHEPALSGIGMTDLILGKLDEALRWMKKSLALEPTGIRHHPSDVGLAYFLLADDAKAEQWFNRALDLQRDLDEAHLWFSWLYLSQGDYRRALEQSRKVLPFSTDYASALHAAGTGELLSDDLARARQDYEKLVAVDSIGRGWVPPVSHLTSFGYVLAKAGQREEALDAFNQSLKLDQKDLEKGNESFVIRYDLAAINAIQGREPQALEWLQKSIDAGFRNYRFALIDPLLESLRRDRQFQEMMAQVKKQVDEMRNRVELDENRAAAASGGGNGPK